MRRAALCLAVALGILAFGLVPSGRAQEGGQSGLISVHDGVVTIDVPIHFAAHRPNPGEGLPMVEIAEIDAFRAKFEADVEAFLNDALAELSFEDCYRFKVDVRTTYADDGFDLAGEWVDSHHIWLSFDAGFRSMTYTASETGLASQDDAGAWEFYSTGEWAYFNMTPRDYAHEVLHLFGLGDDSRPVFNAQGEYDHSIPRPGRDGTLMDSGDELDQDLVDRLGKLLRQAEELPNCWVADMSVHTFRDYNPFNSPPGVRTCDDDWTAEFSLTVGPDGAVSGNGVATLVGDADCTIQPPLPPSARTIAFDVGGEASDASFELQFTLTHVDPPGDMAGFQASLFGISTVAPSIVVPVSAADVAEAEIHLTGAVADTPTSADGTITMTCTSCVVAVG